MFATQAASTVHVYQLRVPRMHRLLAVRETTAVFISTVMIP